MKKTISHMDPGSSPPADPLQAGRRLRDMEKHYLKMIDEIEDYAMFLLDENGIVLNWNKGAEKIKGYRSEEIVGKSFEEFYLPEERKRGKPAKLLNEARDKGRAIAEGWRLRKGGTRFWGNIVITALHDDEGNVIGFSKVTRDFTARKRAEDKLKEYSKTLEFQNAELEEFAYATSHDMKEPLRKIHLYTSYVLEQDSVHLSSKSREFLARAVEATQRMTHLIEDLLAYSKSTSRLEKLSSVNMNEIVSELLSGQREELKQRGIVFQVGQLPVIRAIPFQCKQLMDNLISNAVKYRHPDRQSIIQINCQLLKGSETGSKKADSRKPYYRITVADNGIGFDPAHSERVFEVFQRVHHLPEARGTGIGLAICKKIMQNHGGFITARGKVDEGACFSLYFPVTGPV